MPKITPSLWFDNNIEEAVDFYLSVFSNSKITKIAHYSEAGPLPAGTVMMMEFELDGTPFIGVNGGPHFTYTPAVSFTIDCKDQAEVDHYWNAFADGGEEQQCGWITDKFGLTWQVVPRRLIEMMSDKDTTKAKRVAEAMFTMRKLDIAALERAYAG